MRGDNEERRQRRDELELTGQDKLEKKVERLKDKLDAQAGEIQRLKEERQTPSPSNLPHDAGTVNRRQFLKKAGMLGAAGLGAAMVGKNAAAFDIRSDNAFRYRDLAGDTLLEVDQDGTVTLNGLNGGLTGNTELTEITGDNLFIEDGALNADVETSSTGDSAWREVDSDTIEPDGYTGVRVNRISFEGWNVIDAVERGIDNTGNSDVSSDIEDVIDDETLMVFPSGEYRFDGSADLSGYDNVALVGVAGTEFRFGADTTMVRAGDPSDGEHMDTFVMRNIDVTGDGSTGDRVLTLAVNGNGRAVVQDIRVLDRINNGDSGPLRVRAYDRAQVRIERFIANEGQVMSTSSDEWSAGILISVIEPDATVRVVDCQLQYWQDNGLRSSRNLGEETGRLIVQGGRYYNNNNSQVRSGTDNTLVDSVRMGITDEKDDHLFSPDILYFQGGTGHVARNCYIEVSSDVDTVSRIIRSRGETGTARVEDTVVELDDPPDHSGIIRHSRTADNPYDADEVWMVLESCDIKQTGDAYDSDGLVRLGTDHCKVIDCNIYSEGGSGHSDAVRPDGEYFTLRGGHVEGPETAVRLRGGADHFRIQEATLVGRDDDAIRNTDGASSGFIVDNFLPNGNDGIRGNGDTDTVIRDNIDIS